MAGGRREEGENFKSYLKFAPRVANGRLLLRPRPPRHLHRQPLHDPPIAAQGDRHRPAGKGRTGLREGGKDKKDKGRQDGGRNAGGWRKFQVVLEICTLVLQADGPAWRAGCRGIPTPAGTAVPVRFPAGLRRGICSRDIRFHASRLRFAGRACWNSTGPSRRRARWRTARKDSR